MNAKAQFGMTHVAIVVLLSASALMAWLTVRSVSTGVVYRPWPQMKLEDGPIWFWVNVGGLVVVGLGAAVFALLLIFAETAGYVAHP